MDSKFTTLSNELKIHYLEDNNKSDTTLLMIHGLSSSCFLWTPLIKELNKHKFNIYAIDLKGHGLSGKPENGYSMKSLSEDVINFIKKMNLNNVIIIGQSMGADLGVLVSTKINDKIIGCIGIDGGAINLKQKFLIKKIALKALEPPNMEGIDKDVMLNRMREHRKDWSEEAIQGQFSIFEVDNNNKIKKRLKLENHMKILNGLWDNSSIENLLASKVPIYLILVKFDLNLNKFKNKDVKIEIKQVDGDHDIHAQKPKLVSDLIMKKIKGNFFEKR